MAEKYILLHMASILTKLGALESSRRAGLDFEGLTSVGGLKGPQMAKIGQNRGIAANLRGYVLVGKGAS